MLRASVGRNMNLKSKGNLLTKKSKILILGASGMLGSSVYKGLLASGEFHVYGAVRNEKCRVELGGEIISNLNIESREEVRALIEEVRPNVIVNCIGLIKQLKLSSNPVATIYVNALFPHILEEISNSIGARLIHFSTDCVFSGSKGNYIETDFPDSNDLYGRTKLLGELYQKNTLTLRTSIIGHELYQKNGLLEWFLSQKECVNGYQKAIFSGLPTTEIASILKKYILSNPSLSGCYHLSSSPISKYELLKIIKDVYSLDTEIIPNEDLVIDRSLNCNRFINATNFNCRDWRSMIETMYLSQSAE